MRRLAVGILLAAFATAGVVWVGRGTGSPPQKAAVVNIVERSPRVTVFFGRSCTGPQGAWFLNIVQGGAGQTMREALYLRWSFAGGSRSAKPDGRVTVSGGVAGKVPTATLDRGVLKLTGPGPDSPLEATGTVTVRLTGNASKPTLALTESGLADVEHTLGIQSPFPGDGRPLTVPVRLQQHASGC